MKNYYSRIWKEEIVIDRDREEIAVLFQDGTIVATSEESMQLLNEQLPRTCFPPSASKEP